MSPHVLAFGLGPLRVARAHRDHPLSSSLDFLSPHISPALCTPRRLKPAHFPVHCSKGGTGSPSLRQTPLLPRPLHVQVRLGDYTSPDAPPPPARRPALFIHDFLTDLTLFDGLLQPSSPLLRLSSVCACYDMRGFGKSPNPVGPYSRLDDLSAVHNKSVAASAGSPPGDTPPSPHGNLPAAHVVGAGLGGTVALEYAIAHPTRVASVSLVSSGLPGHRWQRGRAAFFELPRGNSGAPRVQAAKEAARRWVEQSPEWGAALSAGGLAAARLRAMLSDYGGFHFFAEDQLNPDPCEGYPLSHRLGQVQAPVLALVGEGELGGDFGEIGEEIIAAVAQPAYGARTVGVLEGAAHFGTIDAWNQCAKQIAGFWRHVDANSE